jgi:glycosyltransferase involved in cell wall biosynthesis
MPKTVFLAMPVYNRENYLSQALDSILAQTYPHWYLTVLDDGSTDTSVEIAREYVKLDPRIQFVSALHAGQTPALRAAMMATPNVSHGYCGWVDSDDLLAPDALAATVKILDEKTDVGMVYTDYRVIDPHGKDLGLGTRCQIPYSPERLLIDFMTFHFRLMRWEVYDRVGGIDLAFSQAQDYDLCLKISEVTEIYHLCASLYFYRVHPAAITQTQKPEVIAYASQAVRNALFRRGLSSRYRLEVTEGDRFKIVKV